MIWHSDPSKMLMNLDVPISFVSVWISFMFLQLTPGGIWIAVMEDCSADVDSSLAGDSNLVSVLLWLGQSSPSFSLLAFDTCSYKCVPIDGISQPVMNLCIVCPQEIVPGPPAGEKNEQIESNDDRTQESFVKNVSSVSSIESTLEKDRLLFCTLVHCLLFLLFMLFDYRWNLFSLVAWLLVTSHPPPPAKWPPVPQPHLVDRLLQFLYPISLNKQPSAWRARCLQPRQARHLVACLLWVRSLCPRVDLCDQASYGKWVPAWKPGTFLTNGNSFLFLCYIYSYMRTCVSMQLPIPPGVLHVLGAFRSCLFYIHSRMWMSL